MNAVWLVPILAVAFGGVALAALVRSTAESARDLAAEVARFGELHVALARVRTELRSGSETMQSLRDR